jgi:hypothetical protein
MFLELSLEEAPEQAVLYPTLNQQANLEEAAYQS